MNSYDDHATEHASFVQPSREQLACNSPRPREYYRFPYFMIMEWIKAGPEWQK